jgi:acetyltransferase-like isoleucine patch superfamily enzyme
MRASDTLAGLRKRLLQIVALYAPGGDSLRVQLHRWRGVRIGDGTFVGMDALIETEYPEQVWIGRDVSIGIRTTIIAHFRGATAVDRGDREHSVRIEDEVFIGPGCIILPNVTIGHGAVVNAGSVVSSSVPPLTMVAGAPARPVARVGIPLVEGTSLKEFYRQLKPIRAPRKGSA